MRKTRPLLAALAALALVGAGALPAQAATGTYLRLAHFSPDTPDVDVTVTNFAKPDKAVTLKGVGYGAVSGYQRIEPGSYTVAMRPAGADPASDPVISATLDATDGRAYTVAGLGRFADLSLSVLDDDISLPPSGKARMRVINAAPIAGELAIDRAGVPVVEKAEFGQATTYTVIDAGTTPLSVRPTRGTPTDVPVALAAGGVYSVLVLQDGDTLEVQVRTDAKGAEVVPVGGVETGTGGAPLALGLVLLLVAAASGGLLSRRLLRRRQA
jgi:hypothetical protein